MKIALLAACAAAPLAGPAGDYFSLNVGGLADARINDVRMR